MNYEYKYVYGRWETNSSGIEEVLNKYGSDGWDVSTVITGTGDQDMAKIHGIIFKRGAISPSIPKKRLTSINDRNCRHCGTQIIANDNFCPNCGAEYS